MVNLFGGLFAAILVFIIGMACSSNFNTFMQELVK